MGKRKRLEYTVGVRVDGPTYRRLQRLAVKSQRNPGSVGRLLILRGLSTLEEELKAS